MKLLIASVISAQTARYKVNEEREFQLLSVMIGYTDLISLEEIDNLRI